MRGRRWGDVEGDVVGDVVGVTSGGRIEGRRFAAWGWTPTAKEPAVYRDDHVAGSWDSLLARLDRDGAAERWGQLEPVLARPGCLHQLAGRLQPGVDPSEADALLGALVRLAAADGHDEPDAVLLLLHLLSDGATALAGRLADLTADVLALVIGELTVQIRVFPWRRRTRAYAASLLLDTRAALLRELRPHRTRTYPGATEVLIDPTARQNAGLLVAALTAGPDAGDELDLRDVLGWAARTGVAAAGDIALLLQVERTREAGGPAQLRVAAAWGINERTLRRRRERALTALQAARGDYLAVSA